MHISIEEAVRLLQRWQSQVTPLRVHLPGRQTPVSGTVESLTGTVLRLGSNPESFQLDLQGAEFNGDDRAGTSQGAYLVCEFRSGDRCSLYAQEPQSGKHD